VRLAALAAKELDDCEIALRLEREGSTDFLDEVRRRRRRRSTASIAFGHDWQITLIRAQSTHFRQTAWTAPEAASELERLTR
jgi:hypothetical protein